MFLFIYTLSWSMYFFSGETCCNQWRQMHTCTFFGY